MDASFSVTYDLEPARRHILFSCRGRIDRKTYWKWSILTGSIFLLTIYLGLAALTMISGAARADGQIYSPHLAAGVIALFIFSVAASWVHFAILAKRLHDRGRSGWWGLLILIPIVGQLGVLLYAAGLRGSALANKYGNPPLARSKISPFDIAAYLAGLVLMLALSIGGRAFFVEAYAIPSGSNLPDLMPGDYVLVSKYRYRFAAPARGDVAVFINQHTGDAYIKRIAGLPGDTVQVIHGVLNVNGTPWARTRADNYEDHEWIDRFGDEEIEKRYRYIETLPDGTAHDILGGQTKYPEDSLPQDNTKPVKVPEGRFFAIGDNRDNSADSRMELGTVPLKNLLGRAEFCHLSVTPGPNFSIRWSRIFTVVR